MTDKIKKHAPLLIALTLLWVLLSLYLNASLSQNDNNLTYALDDAYIHTAMAKNFAQHGIWGVTEHGFTSSSSSLLWTLTLSALFYLFGANTAFPLMLNFLFASLLLVLVNRIMNKYSFNLWSRTGMLTAFILFIPLPYLVFGGLEHILQILIDIAYIYTAAKLLDENTTAAPTNDEKRIPIYILYVLAFLTVMVRFEGLFILFTVSLLFLFKRKYFQALLNGLCGFLPLLVYGIISTLNGWRFFPNSVVLKGHSPDFSSIAGMWEFIHAGIRQLFYNYHLFLLLLLVLAGLWAYYRQVKDIRKYPFAMGFVFVFVLLGHMFFAQSGYFLDRYPLIRYDTYLAALGLFTLFIILGNLPDLRDQVWTLVFKKAKPNHAPIAGYLEKAFVIFFVALLLIPFLERGLRTDADVVRATANIYGQQIQMSRFLEEYYNNDAVLVNDIGAVCYFSDIRCHDVWGLAHQGYADLRLTGNYSAQDVTKLAAESNAPIAVVYHEFIRLIQFPDSYPKNWILVGQWKIPNNIACARDTVSFFALNQSQVPRLKKNLMEFVPHLPDEVKKQGVYIKPD